MRLPVWREEKKNRWTHTLKPVGPQYGVLFHDVVCHVGSTDKYSATATCTMSAGSQDKKDDGYPEQLLLSFMADFFALAGVR